MADTRKLYEIRFDCMVTMHDSENRYIKGGFITPQKALPPQWFRANQVITLQSIKYADPYTLGMQIKEMYRQLEETINRYEVK